jgi:hypothetical protein
MEADSPCSRAQFDPGCAGQNQNCPSHEVVCGVLTAHFQILRRGQTHPLTRTPVDMYTHAVPSCLAPTRGYLACSSLLLHLSCMRLSVFVFRCCEILKVSGGCYVLLNPQECAFQEIRHITASILLLRKLQTLLPSTWSHTAQSPKRKA